MRFYTNIAFAAILLGIANSAPAPISNNAVAARSYADDKRSESGALNASPVSEGAAVCHPFFFRLLNLAAFGWNFPNLPRRRKFFKKKELC